jgi:predicted permease
MPEGYGFPVAALRWLPFEDDPQDFAVMETPYQYYAFGRLAEGVSMESAQAELTTINARRAAESPDTHEHIRARVMSYTDAHTGMDNAGGLFIVRITMAVLTLLVLVPFVNVAILIYARTATRVGELSIRNALGAGRGRIVAQLFIEALVLASVSSLAGMALVIYGFEYIDSLLAGIGDGGGMPFWTSRGRDPWAAAYVVSLTLLAALVAGVIPGLKATGGGVQGRLGMAASGNGMRLGGAWTALVVLQVATTVGILPFAASMGWQLIGLGMTRPTFEAESLIAGHLGNPATAVSLAAELDAFGDPEERAAARLRTRLAVEEVVRQLDADGRVAAVTHSSQLPGTLFGGSALYEVQGITPPDERPAHRVAGQMAVAADFFAVIGVSPTSGRDFDAVDAEAEAPPIIVNQAFVDQILGGANPLGRSIRRYREGDGDPAPWQEIVGVVDNLVLNPTHPERVESRMYTPLDLEAIGQGAFLVVRTPGNAQSFVPELRKIVTGVDPTLVLGLVTQLGELGGVLNSMIAAGALAFGIVVASGLLLCAAGVFSMMSFSVTQRRREIGVRSALGAMPGQVLRRVLGRSMKQVAIGVVAGLVIVWVIPEINADGIIIDASAGPVAFVALVTVIVGLLAAIGPARRGLRIQPTEAMREG